MAKINKNLLVGDTGCSLEKLVPYVLYDNPSGTDGNVLLNDYYTNYKYFDITWNITDPNNQNFKLDQIITSRVYRSNQMLLSGVVGHAGWNQTGYAITGIYGDGTYIKKNSSSPCTVIAFGYYDTNPTWYNKSIGTPILKIYSVIGYKYN